MNKLPISVIIPCYNSSSTIMRATASVLQQTCLPEELILIDDCSCDNGETLTKLNIIQREFKGKIKVIVLHFDTNQGVSNARNAGWDIATQPYIAFLDSDDAWYGEKLQIQYTWMTKHPDTVLTGHFLNILIHGHGEGSPNISQKYINYETLKINKLTMLFFNYPLQPSTIMLKNNIKNRFKKEKRYCEDRHLFLEIAWDDEVMYILKLPLTFYFKRPYIDKGLSANLWKMEKGELDAFKTLFKEKKISVILLALATIFSLMKYMFRCVRTFLIKFCYTCNVIKAPDKAC